MTENKAYNGLLENDFLLIDFDKYLNCPDCRRVGLYCAKHRMEVERYFKSSEA